MGLSIYALANAIGAPRSRINTNCRDGITSGVALRLGKFFGVDPRWFMNMQAQYDPAIEGERLKDKIAAIETRAARSLFCALSSESQGLPKFTLDLFPTRL